MTRRSALPVTWTALASPILVLGAPRSGTTWLAKIIDSHPDVLYRHEPDKFDDGRVQRTPAVRVSDWAQQRRPGAVTKRPFFRKSWQGPARRLLRQALVAALDAAGRLPPSFRPAIRSVPDLMSAPAPRLLVKSIAFADGAGDLARALPDSRIVLILRHPCGQVASVMRGARQRRFDLRTRGTDMPFDEARAIGHAARHGVSEPEFQALPDAAKYAWSWRTFNETAYGDLAAEPNVHIVVYEALCTDPVTVAGDVMAFAGLGWPSVTAAFLARSTEHQGQAGYYAVFRNAIAAAESWRKSMAPQDIEAVRRVAAGSPLARFWPDLVDEPALESVHMKPA